MLLALTGSVSATFNDAATEPHYGNFLLWESEVSGGFSYEEAHPTRENGMWIYDDASGVLAYVRQNPWSKFDPFGLREQTSEEQAIIEKLDKEQKDVDAGSTKIKEKITEAKKLKNPTKALDAKLARNMATARGIKRLSAMLVLQIEMLEKGEKQRLAMNQVRTNPSGKTLPTKMSDTKNNLLAKDGWVKKAQNVNGIEVHYVENLKSGQKLDFKFK